MGADTCARSAFAVKYKKLYAGGGYWEACRREPTTTEKAVLFVPKEDLFENPDNQANTPTGAGRNTEWEDAFAGMQKLDLFEDDTPAVPDAPAASGAADTGLFEKAAPAAQGPAAAQAPETVQESASRREEEIGAAVFQSLFAGELEDEDDDVPAAPVNTAHAQADVQLPAGGAASQPVSQAVSLDGLEALEDLDVKPLADAPAGLFEDTAPAQPEPPSAQPAVPPAPMAVTAVTFDDSPQEGAAEASQAPAQAASVPVFGSPSAGPAPSEAAPAVMPNPVPRRSGAPKPIDWHVDMLSRIESARRQRAAAQPQPAPAASQQPADVPPQPAAPAASDLDAEPAWKPILESAMMNTMPAGPEDGEATKVFTPPAPRPDGEQPAAEVPAVQFDTAALDLDETGAFEAPAGTQDRAAQTDAPVSHADIASNIAAAFGDDDDDFDATISGLDLSQYPDTNEMEQQAQGKDLFDGDLFDADPEEDEPAPAPKPKRTRAVQDYPGRGGNGGAGKKTGIFVVAALVVLALLVAVYFLFFQKGDQPDPSVTVPEASSSVPAASGSVSGLPADSTSAPDSASTPAQPAATIPRDEWYMRLVNRDQVMTREECDAIATTDVGGVPVDSRAADAFNQLIDAASQAGYTLTMRVGYRTYATQEANYTNGYTDCPAGASEHNLGLAADIFSSSVSDYDDAAYRASAEYQWLVDNAANYGFIERYPAGTRDITGFDPEPWHWRYVGAEQAQLIKASGLTLEQYLAQ